MSDAERQTQAPVYQEMIGILLAQQVAIDFAPVSTWSEEDKAYVKAAPDNPKEGETSFMDRFVEKLLR